MSIAKWLTGHRVGGSAAETRRLESELTELYHAVAPQLSAGNLRAVAVTSAEPGEGRTRTAWLLAEELAANSRGEVLLIDADSRRPTLHDELGIAPGDGLAEVLAGDVALADAVHPTPRNNLSLLTAGTAPLDLGEQVHRAAVDDLLAAAHERYEVVVLDTAPLLEAEETLLFCAAVDGVLLVLLAGITQGEIASRAHRLLQRADAPLLGVVINDPRGEFLRETG